MSPGYNCTNMSPGYNCTVCLLVITVHIHVDNQLEGENYLKKQFEPVSWWSNLCSSYTNWILPRRTLTKPFVFRRLFTKYGKLLSVKIIPSHISGKPWSTPHNMQILKLVIHPPPPPPRLPCSVFFILTTVSQSQMIWYDICR